MSDFWKGVFLGSAANPYAVIEKHITSIELIDINSMTQEDWDVLDYDALRPGTKNMVAEAIVDGSVKGFYAVNMDLHKAHTPHGGKPRYLYPARTGDGFDKEYGTPDFGPSPENDLEIDPNRSSQRLDDLLFWLKAKLTAELAKQLADELAKEKEVPYEEFDNSFELLEYRHQMLIVAMGLFATDPVTARKILKRLDILDDEVYAALNDEEPLE